MATIHTPAAHRSEPAPSTKPASEAVAPTKIGPVAVAPTGAEKLIQCLITMRNKQRPLVREVVVYIGYDLSCNVRLSSTWRAKHDRDAL